MKLSEFLKSHNGGSRISIEGICEEEEYDYFSLPAWVHDEEDMKEFLSDDNPNHYVPSCIFLEPWWASVKDRTIKNWNIIGGHGNPVELWILLEETE